MNMFEVIIFLFWFIGVVMLISEKAARLGYAFLSIGLGGFLYQNVSNGINLVAAIGSAVLLAITLVRLFKPGLLPIHSHRARQKPEA